MEWVTFFKARNIHFVTAGPNVSRSWHMAIKCPWCGLDDKSEHLALHVDGRGFKCWRDYKHSGGNPVKLIQALLKCSWSQAHDLAGNSKALPSDFINQVRGSLVKEQQQGKPVHLSLPAEFKRLSPRYSTKPYFAYLHDRGFSDLDIFEAEDYDIWYSSMGEYKGRIIFTVWYKNKLVGWTGRTIYKNEIVRYKTLSNDGEKEAVPAPAPITDFLLFYDKLIQSSAKHLVLCEGPFDAWRVNLLGYPDIAATCFFTSSVSEQQKRLLHELVPKFHNTFLLLDQNTFAKAARIRSDLVALNVKIRDLPANIKDPGDIRERKILKQCLHLW